MYGSEMIQHFIPDITQFTSLLSDKRVIEGAVGNQRMRQCLNALQYTVQTVLNIESIYSIYSIVSGCNEHFEKIV
ncbi:hypothetical protein BofuT4_uP008780.1 [Botrytis cinerea T4]|uniref:Uncharacterized protein n=1 Tax=Botryotinia fuckeliana (strain T4) TaxID=999810 RepID=G2XX83_BOTF4|nr:hypothetical protein BofuT4_uP008780.1 [Botrytis cinerea T4]